MKTFKKSQHKYTYVFLILVLAVIILVVLEATNTTHLFHNVSSTISSTHPSTTPTTNKQGAAQQSASASTNTSSNISTKSTAPTTPSSTSGAAPLAPSGNFVSDHHPNLSDSPAPSQEESVCITTPGATCYIKLTSGNVIKNLGVQTTDSNGAAFWTWDIKQAGFTTGSWKITAVATLNGQSATANDSQLLVVQP